MYSYPIIVKGLAMEGLFFLLSIIATGLLVKWVIQNDSPDPKKPTHGFFEMK